MLRRQLEAFFKVFMRHRGKSEGEKGMEIARFDFYVSASVKKVSLTPELLQLIASRNGFLARSRRRFIYFTVFSCSLPSRGGLVLTQHKYL
jgi:hypothetical protein